MPKSCCIRRIAGKLAAPIFKSIGILVVKLEEMIIVLDELEAMQLVDFNVLY